jgi:hypothetical protein
MCNAVSVANKALKLLISEGVEESPLSVNLVSGSPSIIPIE